MRQYFLEFQSAEDLAKAQAALDSANIQPFNVCDGVFGVVMWDDENVKEEFVAKGFDPSPETLQEAVETTCYNGRLNHAQSFAGWQIINSAVEEVI